MKYILMVMVTAICLLAGVGMFTVTDAVLPHCHRTSPDLDHDVIAPYVELVGEEGSTGSGAYVGNGIILTADHVVDGGKHFKAVKRGPRGTRRASWDARVISHSLTHDLAVLRVDDPEGLVSANLDPQVTLQSGESCWYVGTPHGLHRSLERSIINSTESRIEDDDYVVVNGNGTHGNSGGPLYVLRGGRYVLVGICSRFAFRAGWNGVPLCFIGPAEIYNMIRGVR